MIPITEDELTELLVAKISAARKCSPFAKDIYAEARRLARLMLASEQMYEALKQAKHDDRFPGCLICSALAAAEGRKA